VVSLQTTSQWFRNDPERCNASKYVLLFARGVRLRQKPKAKNRLPGSS
jgi:hypothetical protein